MGDIGWGRPRERWRLVAFIAWALLVVIVSTAAYLQALPAAHVNVRWAPDVDDQARAALEARFRLSDGEFRDTHTWSYRLTDVTKANVAALVVDPDVEDTHGIDRTTFAVLGQPDPADHLGFSLLVGLAVSTLTLVAVGVWLLALPPLHALTAPFRRFWREAPLSLWVFFVFAVAYVLFFVRPVFLNSDHVMLLEPDIPAKGLPVGIGVDAQLTVEFARAWLERGTPYVEGNSYPPLTTLFYAALVPMPFEWAYALITAATVVAYVFVAFVFPPWVCRGGSASPLLMLIGVVGAFSYGLRFEIERGQFDVIAMSCACAGIALYQSRERYRLLACALVILAAQMKVYPFVFALMLVSRWRAVRENLLRVIALAAVSAALLFVLGPSIFVDFVKGTIEKLQSSGEYSFIGPLNHSIKSWVVLWSRQAADQGVPWASGRVVAIQAALLGVVLACLGAILATAYQSNRKGIDVHVLMGCALCGVIVPAVSHDYTLPILVGPFAALLLTYERLLDRVGVECWRVRVPLLICTAAYACLQFSLDYRPWFLQNNLPVLMAMLGSLVWLSLAAGRFPDIGACNEPQRSDG